MDEDEADNDEFSVNYLESKDRSSWTALNYAAANGHTQIVEILLEAGADVNTKNSKSMVSICFELMIIDSYFKCYIKRTL